MINQNEKDYVVTQKFDTEICGRSAKVETRAPGSPWTPGHNKRLFDYLNGGTKIILNSNREVRLTNIRQHATYSSILEGVSFGPNFKWQVDSEIRWAREDCPDSSIYVIEPQLMKLPFNDDELEALRKFYRVEPVSIGPVACRGHFSSLESVEGLHASYMLIIWFQKDYLAPMDEWTLSRIKDIDWDALSYKETDDEFLANL